MTHPQAPNHTALLPVRVKPLNWKHVTADREIGNYPYDEAVGFGGDYTIEHGIDGYELWMPNQLDGPGYATAEQAKIAAQADYEARILSAIEPDPSSSAQEVRAALESLRARIADDVRYLSDIKRTEYGDGRLDAQKGVLADLDTVLASAPPVRSQEDGE